MLEKLAEKIQGVSLKAARLLQGPPAGDVERFVNRISKGEVPPISGEVAEHGMQAQFSGLQATIRIPWGESDGFGQLAKEYKITSLGEGKVDVYCHGFVRR